MEHGHLNPAWAPGPESVNFDIHSDDLVTTLASQIRTIKTENGVPNEHQEQNSLSATTSANARQPLATMQQPTARPIVHPHLGGQPMNRPVADVSNQLTLGQNNDIAELPTENVAQPSSTLTAEQGATFDPMLVANPFYPEGLPPLDAPVSTSDLELCIIALLEHHCTTAAQNFWNAHRPMPYVALIIPNSARPSRNQPSGPPWSCFRMKTTPNSQNAPAVAHLLNYAKRYMDAHDKPKTLFDFLHRISDMEWERAGKPTNLDTAQQQGDMVPVPLRSHNLPVPSYTSQAFLVQRLEKMHRWASMVVKAVEKSKGPAMEEDGMRLFSRQEFTSVLLAARELVVALNGTEQTTFVEQLWRIAVDNELGAYDFGL